MINNKERIGNFTSSEIHNLMKNGRAKGSLGVPAYTYIDEKKMERRLERSIDTENNARPLVWGELLEGFIFEALGLGYQLVSKKTIVHPRHDYWSGSPDLITTEGKDTVVCDIKAPITLRSFCQLVDPIYEGLEGIEAMNAIIKKHRTKDAYYWQLVSNAILTNAQYAELIVYVPYFEAIEKIRQYASELDIEDQYRYYWLTNANDDELPYLKKGGYYKDLNVIRFEILKEDKDALTERVIMCAEIAGFVTSEKITS